MIVAKRVIQTEKIINFRPKITKTRNRIVERQSSAKTFKSWLESSIKLYREEHKNSPNEKIYSSNDIIAILEGINNKYKELNKLPKEDFIEIRIVEGWKGKGSLHIYQDGFNQDFKIEQTIKDKNGELKTTKKIIPYENVNRILKHISSWKIGETRKCYDFTELLGEKTWQDVIGKRTNVYFPLYYFPIKVLEELEFIDYSGNGEITRLI